MATRVIIEGGGEEGEDGAMCLMTVVTTAVLVATIRLRLRKMLVVNVANLLSKGLFKRREIIREESFIVVLGLGRNNVDTSSGLMRFRL